MFTKIAVGLVASLVSFSSFAVTKTITVTASVDANLEMTQADGSPLPASLALTYLPGPVAGLQAATIPTKIWSNDATKNMEIKLVNDAVLRNVADSSKQYDLQVTHNGVVLSTTAKPLLASTVFPNGAGSEAIPMNLEIGQPTKAQMDSGLYSGQVSIAITQDAGTI